MLAFQVVVARRAARATLGSARLGARHFGGPGLLGRSGGLDAGDALRFEVPDQVGDVLGAFVEAIGIVGGERGLAIAADEAVGKAAAVDAEQGHHAILPLLFEALAVHPDQVVAGAAGVVGTDLETGGEDQAVDLVFHAVHHDAVRGDAIDAHAPGIDQLDVGAIEGGQVAIVQAGPLAHEGVPGLEGLGGLLVLDDFVDAAADVFHFLEVGQLEDFEDLFLGHVLAGLAHAAPVDLAHLDPGVVELIQLIDLAAPPAAAGENGGEVLLPLLLPARLQAGRPAHVGGMVVARIDAGGRALEYIQLLGGFAEIGHALHRGGAGADDADPLVAQAGEVAVGIAAGVVVVPAAGVEGMALEIADARDPGQLGPVQGPIDHDHEAGADPVVAVGVDDPAPGRFVPDHPVDLGLQAGVVVEAVVFGDAAAVGEDLRRVAELARRQVAELFQQRQIGVGLDIAGRARVAVPVPGAAEIGALFDHANIFDTGFPQPRAGQQAAQPAADDRHFHLVLERIPNDGIFDIGIVEKIRKLALHLLILLVAIRAQALVPLGGVFAAQKFRIESLSGCVGAHGCDSQMKTVR